MVSAHPYISHCHISGIHIRDATAKDGAWSFVVALSCSWVGLCPGKRTKTTMPVSVTLYPIDAQAAKSEDVI